MPRVRVGESPLGPAAEMDAPGGGRLLDLCDEMRAAVPFSCRSATCGTCRVDVLEGETHLEPPSDREAEILRIFEDPPSRRLACVARVRPGDGRLCLRVVVD